LEIQPNDDLKIICGKNKMVNFMFSQYYYNGTTSQWLQWDGKQYHVVNNDG